MGIGQKTIFLVDDDPVYLTNGSNTLSQYYNTFTMDSGFRLLKMLESHSPDLILLDIEMPEMNGYETIEILKSRDDTKNIPVIFLTAHSDGESELKGLSLGAIDYISKPFTPSLLLKRIELHLLVESQKKQLVYFSNNLQIMVDSRTRTVVELKNALLKMMAELVEYRGNLIGGHIEKTHFYMSIMLDSLQADDLYKKEIMSWDKELVLLSAQLHDVGKIAIKDNILQKPEKLSDREFEEIKQHVTVGENVIEQLKKSTSERAFLDQAKIIIATHHERWDGNGYPRGLKGEEIPLQGRLMAITDVYNALISDRPYKKALTHNEAIKIISQERGKHFDPSLVDLFLSVSDKFNEITTLNDSQYIELF